MSHPGADALLPTEKYVTSYENGRKVLVLDSVSDDGTYWMYNGRYTYLYDNSGNCVEYHHYDDMGSEVERSLYSYDHTMPLSSTLIPWNPEIDRPRTYDNVDACVREAWYSLDADHVLQYVCDYIYEYNDIVTGIQNTEYQKVSAYPNPASGRVMLVGLQDGAAEVQVYDLWANSFPSAPSQVLLRRWTSAHSPRAFTCSKLRREPRCRL